MAQLSSLIDKNDLDYFVRTTEWFDVKPQYVFVADTIIILRAVNAQVESYNYTQ